MNQTVQLALYYSDFILITLFAVACFFSYKFNNVSVRIFSLLLIVATAIRHICVSEFSKLEDVQGIELWFLSFFFIYFVVVVLAILIHTVLLLRTTIITKVIYVFLTINIIFYAYMHFQRAVYHIHTPSFSWDVYEWTVASSNYIVAFLLIYKSLGFRRPWNIYNNTNT